MCLLLPSLPPSLLSRLRNHNQVDIDVLDARWREKEGRQGRGRRRGTQSVRTSSRRHITTYGELDGISDNAGKARRRRGGVVIDREGCKEGGMLEGSSHSIILAVFLLIHCRAERPLRFPTTPTFFRVILDLGSLGRGGVVRSGMVWRCRPPLQIPCRRQDARDLFVNCKEGAALIQHQRERERGTRT